MRIARRKRYGRRGLRRQQGVTALEYGILAAIVALIIGTTVYTQLGSAISSIFSTMSSAAISVISH
ncbi:pilus assembly protein [Pandoraea iniqua]|uniref:Pilus assembly protein n=1 Tax=Pandoraea iniqua TaxID=2508288 RepID=A0A5E4VJW2_9BURK|nr:Flp family type IVb pilin [Pandoraea iniqua]VVE11674.1 pilus assembly protein [Pandoraea iniqua]VVE19780.1 pilus assembly protein [Pandoraea iniqua]